MVRPAEPVRATALSGRSAPWPPQRWPHAVELGGGGELELDLAEGGVECLDGERDDGLHPRACGSFRAGRSCSDAAGTGPHPSRELGFTPDPSLMLFRSVRGVGQVDGTAVFGAVVSPPAIIASMASPTLSAAASISRSPTWA